MTGIVDKIRAKWEASTENSDSKTVYWDSVAVLDGDDYDEPMLLQQRYVPDRGLTNLYPWGTHRIVPLSDIDISEPDLEADQDA